MNYSCNDLALFLQYNIEDWKSVSAYNSKPAFANNRLLMKVTKRMLKTRRSKLELQSKLTYFVIQAYVDLNWFKMTANWKIFLGSLYNWQEHTKNIDKDSNAPQILLQWWNT